MPARRRCIICLLAVLSFSLPAVYGYGHTNRRHSFADWNLPECPACDLTLIQKNLD